MAWRRSCADRASFYANSLSGRPTASGERYDPKKLTAANRSLPFGTCLRVARIDNGKSVVVKVNDRGPFGHRSRILDLSRRQRPNSTCSEPAWCKCKPR